MIQGQAGPTKHAEIGCTSHTMAPTSHSCIHLLSSAVSGHVPIHMLSNTVPDRTHQHEATEIESEQCDRCGQMPHMHHMHQVRRIILAENKQNQCTAMSLTRVSMLILNVFSLDWTFLSVSFSQVTAHCSQGAHKQCSQESWDSPIKKSVRQPMLCCVFLFTLPIVLRAVLTLQHA